MILVHLGKFSLVGLLGAALQIVLLPLLANLLQLPVLIATPLAVELILLHNFVWHENFTWHDRRFANTRQRITALARFHLSNGTISLFGNTALMYLFVVRFRMPVTLSAVAAIVLCGVLNFLSADRLVYRRIQILNPAVHHFPLARAAPPHRDRGVRISRLIRRIIEVPLHLDARARGQVDRLLGAIRKLPVELIVRNGK